MFTYKGGTVCLIHCRLLKKRQKIKPAFPFRIQKICQIKQQDTVPCCILNDLVLVLLTVVLIINFKAKTRKGEVANTLRVRIRI